MEKRTSQLRQERERRGWSRNYIAEQVEVDVITVGRWERNEKIPHPHHRQKLCILFEKNAEELGFFSESPYLSDDKLANMSEQKIIADRIAESDAPALERKNSDTLTLIIDHPQERLASGEEIRQTSFFTRRRALIGLGGFGIAALVAGGGLWRWHAITSDATVQAVQNSQRFYHLLDPNLDNWVNRISWSPDNRKLAAANGENVVSIWSLDSGGMLLNYYPVSKGWINDVSWSKNNWLAAARADLLSGSLCVWQTTTDKLTFTLDRPYGLRSVSWSPDGQYLAFAGRNSTVEVWDPFTQKQVQKYSYPQLGKLGINRVKWSATGTYLACAADDGTIQVWEALTGVQKAIYQKHTGRVHDLAWSPDMRYIASAGADKAVQVWEVVTGRTVLTYRGHTGEVEGLDWSPQGKYIASGGNDLLVHIWEALTGKLIVSSEKNQHPPEGMQWSLDEKMLAVATAKDGIIVLQSPH